MDASIDSGIYSHPSGEPMMDDTYDKVPTAPPRVLEPNFYDPIPSPTSKQPRIYEVDMKKVIILFQVINHSLHLSDSWKIIYLNQSNNKTK